MRPECIRTLSALLGGAMTLIGVLAATAQESPRGARPAAAGAYPRLPDAATRPPDWIGAGAPFDVARFFAAPPRDRNAAPLYLDALFEFSSGMESCFSPGRERDRRRQAAAERERRFNEAMTPLFNDPKAVLPPSQADAILRDYEVGFRKLAEARRRDRCVFEASLTSALNVKSIYAMVPHAHAARAVVRVAAVRAQRAVQRGNLDAAIDDVEAVLRLDQDLRPRGGLSAQLVSAAVLQVVGSRIVPPILASPRLRVAHCDRLLKVLASHELKSADAYGQAVRAGYVEAGTTLRGLIRDQATYAARLGLKPGESVVKEILGGGGGRIEVPRDADSRLTRTGPAEVARAQRELDRYYTSLLELEGLTGSERWKRANAIRPTNGEDLLSHVLLALESPHGALVEATARAEATDAALECLVALRRWQLAHRGSPRALAVAVREAGLKAIPVDPYDGRPMRLAVIDGQPVVYSVGKDGVDDGGRVDSNLDMRPSGDLLYRLPPVEENPGIRPT